MNYHYPKYKNNSNRVESSYLLLYNMSFISCQAKYQHFYLPRQYEILPLFTKKCPISTEFIATRLSVNFILHSMFESSMNNLTRYLHLPSHTVSIITVWFHCSSTPNIKEDLQRFNCQKKMMATKDIPTHDMILSKYLRSKI